MSLTGWQINPIDVNFHLQKSLEIFDKISADPKRTRDGKCPPSCQLGLKHERGDTFIFFKILKEPMLVQKQTAPHLKAWILIFLELEGEGRGIIMGAPRLLPVETSIKVKEIKV
jgi:hypothetical protein